MSDPQQHFAVEWLRLYGDKLYSYALARTGHDAGVAEDLVQETLLSGIKGHQGFRGQAKLETWLISILRKKIIDHYRRSGRNRERVASDAGDGDRQQEIASVASSGIWGRDAALEFESKEFQDIFDSCLREINPQLAEAFMMVVMDGLSTQETCSLLGITPTNLSVRLCRARLELREKLQSRWFRSQ